MHGIVNLGMNVEENYRWIRHTSDREYRMLEEKHGRTGLMTQKGNRICANEKMSRYSFRRLYQCQSKIYSTLLSKITKCNRRHRELNHVRKISSPGSYPQTNLSGEADGKRKIRCSLEPLYSEKLGAVRQTE